MKIDILWKSYKETKQLKYKQELIEHYSTLVKIIAGRMYNFYAGNIEYDDLIGFGVFGLIDAIDKFDLDRDLKFQTYAQIRIRGSIIDNLRKLDWIPRGIRKKSKDLEKTISQLENKLGRTATTKEIADEMNLAIEEVNNILTEVSTLNVVSLEETLQLKGEVSMDSNNSQNPEKTYENNEMKSILSDTIKNLKEKEKLVISLYYYEELTYKEIGNILNLSESRISQIHSKAIIMMKNNLKRQGIENY